VARRNSVPIKVIEGDFSFDAWFKEIQKAEDEFAQLPAEEQARVAEENTREMKEFFAKNPGGFYAII
jgi:hypothetical protein